MLNRPRRTITALLIATLLGGGGLILAGAKSEPSESAWTLPARHVGDAGSYRVTIDGTAVEDVEFHWADTTVFKDSTGTWRIVDELVRSYRFEAFGEVHTFNMSSYVDADSGEPVAAGTGASAGHTKATGIGGTKSSSSETQSVRFDANGFPCGFVNGLQGGAAMQMHGCGEGAFTATGIVPFQDGEALLIEGEGAKVWFVADVPYPARSEVRTGDHTVVTELLAFGRGDAPGKSPVAPERTPMPDIAWADADRLGPVGPADHPYPLPVAVQDALEEPDHSGLRDFTQAHPAWRLASASYFEKAQDGDILYGWQLEVVSERAGLTVLYGHHEYDLAPDLAPLLGSAQRQHDVVWRESERDGLPADAWPDQMPEVASVQRAWSVYAERPAEEATLWGFRVGACNGCQAAVWAGDVDRRTIGASGVQVELAPPPSRSEHEGLALVYEDGILAELWLGKQSHERSTTPSGPVGPAHSAPARSQEPPLVAALAWHVPAPAAAAGVGAFALAAALLYWLWPALQGAPVLGLFSRLRHDRLREHPTRAAILSLVAAEPGVHYKELTRRLERGHGAVEHHLARLEDNGLVRVLRRGGYRCYFPKGTPPAAMGSSAALKAPGARALLEAVAAAPGCTAKQAAARCGLAPSTVHHHLQRLREAGLVDVRRVPGGLALHPLRT